MSSFEILVDGCPINADEAITLAAALWNAGIWAFRTSADGELRGPLCAMGTCFECRVTIDGVSHRRACMEPCRPGMEVRTRG